MYALANRLHVESPRSFSRKCERVLLAVGAFATWALILMLCC